MDELDRKIINELQDNFPIAPNPYEIMASNIGIATDVFWQRVQALVGSGLIRRIGFSIDSRKMGYSSTLAAICVSPDRIEEASQLISHYPQVTHSYLREDAFNIWFTVIAEDEKGISAILESIRSKLDLSHEDIMDLPVKRLFKLDARFH